MTGAAPSAVFDPRAGERLRIAVVGGGVAGITAAHLLQRRHDVVLFERNDYVGGHTHTIAVPDGPDAGTPVDTGFIVLNDRTYPAFQRLLVDLGVGVRPAEMSFSLHDERRGFFYAGSDLNGLFAQRRNAVRPSFLRMLRDILRFSRDGLRTLERGSDAGLPLRDYLARRAYGPELARDYLVPMSAAIWSTSPAQVLDFPAVSLLRFFRNHGLLSLRDRPQWQTVGGGSQAYVRAFLARFAGRVHTASPVGTLRRTPTGVVLRTVGGQELNFDRAVIAAHADEALALLADPSEEERRLLGAWRYLENRTVLHADPAVLPPRRRAWASWNFVREAGANDAAPVSVSYWMNLLQGLEAHHDHLRTAPVRHEFRYAVSFYAFDLDELSALERESRLFGYNRVRPVSVHDADYLQRGGANLREKLAATLAAHGVQGPLGRAMLVTAARYLHYVFNPVSFFYCWGKDEALLAVIAHVNNTFGESHLYVLADPLEPQPAQLARYGAPKAFHVSPFFAHDGEYEFRFSPVTDRIEITLLYRRAGEHALTATLSGDAIPFSAEALRRTLLRHPLAPALTMPRILREAAALHFAKKLPVFRKPVPRHADTIRVPPPGPLQRRALAATVRALEGVRRGAFALELPGGATRRFRGPEPGPEAHLRVLDHRFFPRVLLAGDVGLGESFTSGEWDSPDLAAVLRFFAENLDDTRDEERRHQRPRRWLHQLRHLLRDNTPAASRRNSRAHYDLGNEFFALFLDASMTYSCALYEDPSATLDEAQRAKRLAVIRKARLRPGDHVLEIGCGWGAFAIEAARTAGCRVTGITLSPRQLEEARRRVAAAGLADRVTIELADYRHVPGHFDRIVSIEMLEAVGHRHLGDFFAACDRMMTRGGRQVHQTITIPDWRYDDYRRNPDWIRTHIFPGGHLSSLAAMASAMAAHSRLVVETVENIGPHYARTLREWRARFLARLDAAKGLGFDEGFLRGWEYYFAYCEAGFDARYLGALQLVLVRSGEAQ